MKCYAIGKIRVLRLFYLRCVGLQSFLAIFGRESAEACGIYGILMCVCGLKSPSNRRDEEILRGTRRATESLVYGDSLYFELFFSLAQEKDHFTFLPRASDEKSYKAPQCGSRCLSRVSLCSPTIAN